MAGREELGLAPHCPQLPSLHPKTRQNSTDRGWHLGKETCTSAQIPACNANAGGNQMAPGRESLAFGDLAPGNEFEVKHCVFSSDF